MGAFTTRWWPPSDAQQPGPRGHDRCIFARSRREETGRGERVRPEFGQMLMGVVAVVVADIRNCARGLPARAQRVGMIPVREHATPASCQRVEALRDADAQALHGASEARDVDGFDEQMQVVSEDRVVDDAHPEPDARLSQRGLDEPCAPPSAQISDARLHTERDVDGEARGEGFARQMRHSRADEAGMGPGARAARAFAATAPAGKREIELSSHDS